MATKKFEQISLGGREAIGVKKQRNEKKGKRIYFKYFC